MKPLLNWIKTHLLLSLGLGIIWLWALVATIVATATCHWVFILFGILILFGMPFIFWGIKVLIDKEHKHKKEVKTDDTTTPSQPDNVVTSEKAPIITHGVEDLE